VIAALAHVLTLLVLPWLVVGVVNRTRSLWSGRRGPPLFQSLSDVLRLLRKRPVYSTTTTALFRLTPYVALASTLATAAVVPVLGGGAPVEFGYDFVWLAYVWGLGRAATMLGALDTGSSFEGMGASREATFATLVEPGLFLAMGAACLTAGTSTLSGALAMPLAGGPAVVVWAASLVALLVLVQAEAARVPIDDPATHLELTMIHEVMVLDHSGPELAAIQTGAAVKLTLGLAMIAALLNPSSGVPGAAFNVGAVLGLAVVIGTIESLVARFAMRAVPRYLGAAVVAGAIAVLATTWQGGAP
jgi:formate hydrogenlyase subunit 4